MTFLHSSASQGLFAIIHYHLDFNEKSASEKSLLAPFKRVRCLFLWSFAFSYEDCSETADLIAGP